MAWFIWGGVFVAALALLVKSADKFVEAADEAGRILGVPEFIMGITLVALGTSLPEAAASLAAVAEKAPFFIIGNAVGSNVTNVLLILGLSSLWVKDFRSRTDLGSVDLPLLIISAALVTIFAWTDKVISRPEGYLLLAGYALYLVFTVLNQQAAGRIPTAEKRAGPFIWLAVAAAGIYFGADYTLKATIKLTSLFGFADTSVMALSAVALGTSLPELVVSIAAARKGNLDLCVGNIIGSNIFNSLVVLGLPALIIPLPTSEFLFGVGLPYMAVASLIGYLILIRRRIDRAMGGLLLLLYLAFLSSLFGLLR